MLRCLLQDVHNPLNLLEELRLMAHPVDHVEGHMDFPGDAASPLLEADAVKR